MAAEKGKRELPLGPEEITAQKRRHNSQRALRKELEWTIPFGEDNVSVGDSSTTVNYEQEYPTPQQSFTLEPQDGNDQQQRQPERPDPMELLMRAVTTLATSAQQQHLAMNAMVASSNRQGHILSVCY